MLVASICMIVGALVSNYSCHESAEGNHVALCLTLSGVRVWNSIYMMMNCCLLVLSFKLMLK
jgi:hypothetical protein